ncbi:unnamed protein product [Peniophora sp. CBMAI 1063]|nr:unnamed protein product [Peniophora sp. CBMAI 1063]
MLACSQTCKYLHALVSSSSALQYSLALSATGTYDGPASLPLSTSERLSLLQTRRKSWRTLTLNEPAASIHLPGNCQAYDLVGGYYGKCAGPADTESDSLEPGERRSITLVTLPSNNPRREAGIETYDLGVQIKDFAMDPSQDLIAFLEMPRQDGRVRLHMRRLSEPGAAHPLASVGVLEGSAGRFVRECMVDIAEDVVALYARELGPRVIIFNWRTGEELVNMQPPHHDVPPHDFSFVSPRAFLLTYAHTDAIRLFSFSTTSPSNSKSKTLDVTSTLRLPPPAVGARFLGLNTLTGPWLARAPPHSAYHPANARRVHTFCLTVEDIEGMWHELMLVVPGSALVGIIQAALWRPSIFPRLPALVGERASGEDEKGRMVGWDKWITKEARVVPMAQAFEWQRYVHGARMLARGTAGLHLFDFDVPVKDGERDKWRDARMFARGSVSVFESGERGVLVEGILHVGRNRGRSQSRGSEAGRTGDGENDGGEDDGTEWAENLVIDEVAAMNQSHQPLIDIPRPPPLQEDGEQELFSSLPYGCVCVPVPEVPKDGRGGVYTGFMLDEQRLVGVRSVADGEVLDVWTF